ncbi:MAG: hypothetical protein ABFR02_00320 [Campylobacterota bacterium]
MNIFLPLQKILLLTALFLFELYALEPEHKQLLPPKATQLLLETIKEHAIVFGKGEQDVHIFIDPYCPFAQKHLSLLLENSEEKFKENTYYFYLYKLKQKDSKEAIQTILSAEDKREILIEIMVNDDFFIDENLDVEAKIRAIADVAKKIGVNKRPYILVDGKLQ